MAHVLCDLKSAVVFSSGRVGDGGYKLLVLNMWAELGNKVERHGSIHDHAKAGHKNDCQREAVIAQLPLEPDGITQSDFNNSIIAPQAQLFETAKDRRVKTKAFFKQVVKFEQIDPLWSILGGNKGDLYCCKIEIM